MTAIAPDLRGGEAVRAELAGLAGLAWGGREGDIEVEAPFTGEVLGGVAGCGAGDVVDAAAAARAAQAGWAATPARQRADVLLRFHDLVLDRREEILDLIQLETGKARLHALEEVLDTAIVARYYGHTGPSQLRTQRRRGALPFLTATWEARRPVGLVGVIAPWNYPLDIPLGDALPALVAGNAVVVKPDHRTPFCALWGAGLAAEAGLPEGLLQVVVGEPEVVGPAVVDNVDHVAFTGSTTVGRMVARRAAERLVGTSLELGGKNAMVVMDDADLTKAVDGAVRGCFTNAGQLCISLERLLVHRSVVEELTGRLAERVKGLKLGTGLHYGPDMGSLTWAGPLARTRAHVEDARSKGATVLAGGCPRPDLGPYFHEPTVLADVGPDMEVWAEETFGPVATVTPFASLDDAGAAVDAGRYGLSASVWSRDVGRARRFGARLDVGAVNINEPYAAAWASTDAPYGGVKDSGSGRRHGAEGLLRLTTSQTVAVQRLLPISPPPGLSGETYARLMTAALRTLRRLPGVR